jgi:ADP-heptose:LPS heptosyltransferase
MQASMTNSFSLASQFLSAFRKDPFLRKSLVLNTGYLLRTMLQVHLGGQFTKIIIINLTEHIGDIVACEPVSYHLRKLHPKAFIIWSVNKKYNELVNYNPHINAVLNLSCLTEWICLKKLLPPFIKIYDLHINGKRCSKHLISSRNSVNTTVTFFNYLHHGNLLQIAAKVAGIDDIPDYTPRFHFKNQEQPGLIKAEYIVLHTLSNEPERNWSSEKWNELVNRFLEKYPAVHIVEIGLKSIIETDNTRYHNLTGKLDLQEVAHIIDSSVLFIGVESGFAHLANALSKNSIILIGYFHEFRNYMVYSGAFARRERVSLLYYQGLLQKLDIREVEKAVDIRITNR